jgi:hypothetical protein
MTIWGMEAHNKSKSHLKAEESIADPYPEFISVFEKKM